MMGSLFMPVAFTLIALLLCAGALAWLAAVLLLAHGLCHPPRLTDGKALRILNRLSPADLNLHFTPLSLPGSNLFTSTTPMLAAWFVPAEAPSDRTVVIVHGYADAKVGSLAYLPFLRAAGVNCLLIDLRACGDSKTASATPFTFGPAEAHDLVAALDHFRQLLPERGTTLLAFGISLGASICLLAQSIRPGLFAALICESPHLRLDTATVAHASIVGLPGSWVTLPALAYLNLCFRCNDVSPAFILPTITSPILALLPSDDPYLPGDQRATFKDLVRRTNAKSLIYEIPAPHMHTPHADPMAYEAAISRFLSSLD